MEEPVCTSQSKSPSIFRFISPRFWLDKTGIEKRDIPRTLITFKGLCYVPWLVGIGVCYRYQPTKMFMASKTGQSMLNYLKTHHANRYDKTTNFINTKVAKAAESTYVRWIPDTLGLKSKRFAKAFIESTIGYKFCLPVIFPTCLYVAIKMTQHANAKKQKLADNKNSG